MESFPTLERDRVAGEEALLVARLAAGEREEPLAELYRIYGRRIYGLGLRLFGGFVVAPRRRESDYGLTILSHHVSEREEAHRAGDPVGGRQPDFGRDHSEGAIQ